MARNKTFARNNSVGDKFGLRKPFVCRGQQGGRKAIPCEEEGSLEKGFVFGGLGGRGVLR